MTVCVRDRDRMEIKSILLDNGEELELETCEKCGEFHAILKGNMASYVPSEDGG